MGRISNIQQFHRHLAFLHPFSCAFLSFYETSMSVQWQSWPQSNWQKRARQHRSYYSPWKCHQTVHICVSYLAVWHLNQSPHALRSYISTPLQLYMDIMCSVFPLLICLKTVFMTHSSYTPNSAWKYNLHTNNTTLSKTVAPGNLENFYNKLSQNESGQWTFSHHGPHPEMSKGTSTLSLKFHSP